MKGRGVMRRRFLLGLAVPALCLALASLMVRGAGDRAGSLQKLRVGNVTRTYILHLPKERPKGKMPLLIALHGYSITAQSFQGFAGFDARADQGGFAVVYPNGTCEPQMWNAGGPYEYWTNLADDVGFISKLIDTLAARYPIDTERVCVTGHSNGAHMAYRLARALSEKVAAIAPVAGSSFDMPYPEPRREVTVLHLHAQNDDIVPMGGKNLGGYTVLPIEKNLAYWIAKGKCDPTPVTFLDKDGVRGRRWLSASGYGDVCLYTFSKGAHSWPQLATSNLDAAEVIGDFVMKLKSREQ